MSTVVEIEVEMRDCDSRTEFTKFPFRQSLPIRLGPDIIGLRSLARLHVCYALLPLVSQQCLSLLHFYLKLIDISGKQECRNAMSWQNYISLVRHGVRSSPISVLSGLESTHRGAQSSEGITPNLDSCSTSTHVHKNQRRPRPIARASIEILLELER
jgi:hypothetical protein